MFFQKHVYEINAFSSWALHFLNEMERFVVGEHECRNRFLFFNLDAGVFQRCALFSPLIFTHDDGLRFLMSQLERKISHFLGRVNVLASHFINFHDSLKIGEKHPMTSTCLNFQCASFGSFRFLLSAKFNFR